MPGDHTVEIDYSNVIYNVADTSKGIPPDIDGCTLFQYGGADITATAGLTDGVIRACAGAVQDSVHEATVTIHAAYSGVNAVNLPLTLTYDASFDYTDCQVPQFIDDLNQNRPVSTLTRTTDSNGNITITVLSCDLISTPNVLITNNGTQIGSIPCNFAADQSLRHYGILTYDPGEGSGTDTGWDFNSYSLINPGDTADAIVFLKFEKDPNFQLPGNPGVSVDPNYYLSSLAGNNAVPSLDVNHYNYVSDEEYNAGTIRGKSNHPLDDASNWLPVSGHNVHVRITQITNLDTGATINDPLAIKQYLYYVDGNSNPVDENNQPYVMTLILPQCRHLLLQQLALTGLLQSI